MHVLDALHESMEDSLQRLGELPAPGRALAAQPIIACIEGDLAVERRLLGELDIRIPGLSGVDPISTLQQAEVSRLLARLKEPDGSDGPRWAAALSELRLQLEAAFGAVDQALSECA